MIPQDPPFPVAPSLLPEAKFEGAYGKASWFTSEEDLGSGLFRQALVWRLKKACDSIKRGWWCFEWSKQSWTPCNKKMTFNQICPCFECNPLLH